MVTLLDKKIEQKPKNSSNKGSITVEAALALPLFLSIVISFAFLMRVVYTHELIQHAISETANEIAASGYIYHVSGLQEMHDTIQDGIKSRAQVFKEHMAEVIDAYGNLQEVYGEVKDLIAKDGSSSQGGGGSGAFESVDEAYETITSTIDSLNTIVKTAEEIAENPLEELKSIAAYMLEGEFDEFKTRLCIPLVKLYMKKHFMTGKVTDMDKRLKLLGVVDGSCGLDFSESGFFEDEKNEIDIVVGYKIKLPVPVRILPDIYIVQRASVKAWLGGNEKAVSNISDKDDIWSLSNFERGRKLREIFGGNLPSNFPVIAKFEAGTATMIKSIDLTAKTYQDSKEVEEAINEYTDKLLEFKGQEKPWGSKGIIIKEEEIKVKELLLILPGNPVKPEISMALETCKEKARNKGISIKVETYGARHLTY